MSEAMTNDRFWQLIEEAKAASNGDPVKQAKILEDRLVELSVGEIVTYDRIHTKHMYTAFKAALWEAALMVTCGWCSEDGFTDFRAWLIGQGREAYHTVVENPARIIDYLAVGEESQCEYLLYVAMNAYKRKTGDERMPKRTLSYPELDRNYSTSTKTLKEKYPVLYQEFTRWCIEEDYYFPPKPEERTDTNT